MILEANGANIAVPNGEKASSRKGSGDIIRLGVELIRGAMLYGLVDRVKKVKAITKKKMVGYP